jgi:hypothetical protein
LKEVGQRQGEFGFETDWFPTVHSFARTHSEGISKVIDAARPGDLVTLVSEGLLTLSALIRSRRHILSLLDSSGAFSSAHDAALRLLVSVPVFAKEGVLSRQCVYSIE